MEVALHDMVDHNWFAGFDSDTCRMQDDSMISRSWLFLEESCLTKITLADVFGSRQSKALDSEHPQLDTHRRRDPQP